MRPTSKVDSEEANHCHLICCVYIKGHVETVKYKGSNHLAIALWYVCRHCRLSVASKHSNLQSIDKLCNVETVDTQVAPGSYTTPYTWVQWGVKTLLYSVIQWPLAPLDYKTHAYVDAHNWLLHIQLIFDPQKVSESWDWVDFLAISSTYYICRVLLIQLQGSLMHSVLSMPTLWIQNTSTWVSSGIDFLRHSTDDLVNLQVEVLESWD